MCINVTNALGPLRLIISRLRQFGFIIHMIQAWIVRGFATFCYLFIRRAVRSDAEQGRGFRDGITIIRPFVPSRHRGKLHPWHKPFYLKPVHFSTFWFLCLRKKNVLRHLRTFSVAANISLHLLSRRKHKSRKQSTLV